MTNFVKECFGFACYMGSVLGMLVEKLWFGDCFGDEVTVFAYVEVSFGACFYFFPLRGLIFEQLVWGLLSFFVSVDVGGT